MDKAEEQRLINEALYGLIEVFQEIDNDKIITKEKFL